MTLSPRPGGSIAGALLVSTIAIRCAKPEISPSAEPAVAPSASASTGNASSIHVPERLLGLPTGRIDARGEPVSVACVTCHSLRRPAALPEKMTDLDEFHQGLSFRHGSLACGSCHVVGDQDSLHQADGTIIPLRDAIALCAQCHGSQYRDYQRRSHGGTNGHWDARQGPSVRNHCLDCHDAHTPKFLPSMPVLPPRDRGTVASQHPAAEAHAGHAGHAP